MTYAAVILFKVFLLVTSVDHPLDRLLNHKSLRLPEYLDRSQSLLSSLSHNNSFHSANKFLDIITRITQAYKTHLNIDWSDGCHFIQDGIPQNYGEFENEHAQVGIESYLFPTEHAEGLDLTAYSAIDAGAKDRHLSTIVEEQYFDDTILGTFFDQHSSAVNLEEAAMYMQ